MKRRDVIQTAVAVGLLGPGAWLAAAEQRLTRTPRDFAGPFYPTGKRHRTNDLIVGTPRTDVLDLRGTLLDPLGTPIAGALIDIWQADPEGRYRHPRDTRRGERWDEFLYWGEATTGADGSFGFRTYVPGAYASRPAAHIHYKVWFQRQLLLTSQIYFEELGGPQGLAWSDAAATLQTTSLRRIDNTGFAAEVRIIV